MAFVLTAYYRKVTILNFFLIWPVFSSSSFIFYFVFHFRPLSTFEWRKQIGFTYVSVPLLLLLLSFVVPIPEYNRILMRFFFFFLRLVNFSFNRIQILIRCKKKKKTNKPFFKFNEQQRFILQFKTNENTGTGVVHICVTAFFVYLDWDFFFIRSRKNDGVFFFLWGRVN